MEMKWIPVSERLPEEHDSIFARYYDTPKWNSFMHKSASDEVIVTVAKKDETVTTVMRTFDSKWKKPTWAKDCDVIAWMPLPEPYQEPDENAKEDEGGH